MIVLILWDTLSYMIDSIYKLRSENGQKLSGRFIPYVEVEEFILLVLVYIGQPGSKKNTVS